MHLRNRLHLAFCLSGFFFAYLARFLKNVWHFLRKSYSPQKTRTGFAPGAYFFTFALKHSDCNCLHCGKMHCSPCTSITVNVTVKLIAIHQVDSLMCTSPHCQEIGMSYKLQQLTVLRKTPKQNSVQYKNLSMAVDVGQEAGFTPMNSNLVMS